MMRSEKRPVLQGGASASDVVLETMAGALHKIARENRSRAHDASITQTASGELALMALSAILLRAALFILGTHIHGWSLDDFVNLRDGSSYIHFAQALRGDSGAMTLFDRRVFVGFPALIAGVSMLGVSVQVAGLALTWLATAVTGVLTAILYDDRRMGWAMVMLTPSYLMYTTTVMSEGVLLAFTVAGLVLVYRARPARGGFLLGCAGLIRPMACFAVIGAAMERLRVKRRTAVTVCVTSAAVVGVGLLLLQIWTGDATQNVRIYASDEKAYAGQLFALPFESLVMTPIKWHVPLWKVAYIWTYVTVALIACVLVVRRALASADADERAVARFNAPWLVGNTIFVLCIGYIWGFHEFHRFIVPALPPLLWVFRDYYPRRLGAWTPIAGLSFAIALFGLLRS